MKSEKNVDMFAAVLLLVSIVVTLSFMWYVGLLQFLLFKTM